MKANEAGSSSTASSTKRDSHVATFAKVFDGRKQPIRGLWVRNGRFYAQLKIENPVTGVKKTKRIPLLDKDGVAVSTIPQAVAELNRLHTHRADDTLRQVSRTDKFKDYAKRYLDVIEGTKATGTIEKEKSILGRWTDEIGELRLDQIKRVHVNRFIEARLKETPAPSRRTINLDVITFRVVMKRALSDGLIQRLPTEGLKPFKVVTPKRGLITAAEIEKLCTAAFGKRDGTETPVTENAQQFVDYIRLMALSGARRNEALGLRWGDIDGNQLYFRRQVKPKGIQPLKNSEERSINLNPKLKAHLAEMKKRRAPDTDWIFPSPQRGNKDIPAQSFRESLDLARAAAKMPGFNFHDCRHHFISMCVMSGIDFMTIAAWVGHKDGGVLIGKVYGHLANEHREAMAARVNFGPVIVAA